MNASIFDDVPSPTPYILKEAVSEGEIDSPYGKLESNSSYVYKLSKHPAPPAPGGGGTLAIVDSRNFPIAKTLAAAIVTLEPRGLRELHWHPNVLLHFFESPHLSPSCSWSVDFFPIGRRMAILPSRPGSRYSFPWWCARPHVWLHRRRYCRVSW